MSAGDTVGLRLNEGRRGVTDGDREVVRSVGVDSLVLQIGDRLVELDGERLSLTTAHGDPVIAQLNEADRGRGGCAG